MLLAALAMLACGPKPQPAAPALSDDELGARVVADFERAVLESREAYLALFDFVAVGAYEKLLRRTDLLGRIPDISPRYKAQLEKDTPEAYPPDRERRNVGAFYPFLAQRTVGTGGCRVGPPRDWYAAGIAEPFAPLPAGSEAWEPLRADVNPLLERGGMVAFTCEGGKGGLALVYTRTDGPRGYDIITIYDDPAP